jgi:hypothetical protein
MQIYKGCEYIKSYKKKGWIVFEYNCEDQIIRDYFNFEFKMISG